MEEFWKLTREDNTDESVKYLVLAYYKMTSLVSGSDLKDTDNFASRLHKILQLEYFEENAKFPIEKDEREDEKSVKREEGEGMDVRAKKCLT